MVGSRRYTQRVSARRMSRCGDEPMGEQPLAVRVPVTIDKWVRSHPDRANWLRKAITDAYQREVKFQNEQSA